MPPRGVRGLDSERNRIQRRDKKRSKRRSGMRVDDSARKLALEKLHKELLRRGEADAWFVPKE